MTASVLYGIWTIVIQLLLSLKRGTLKPDCSGECLNSTDESKKDVTDTFNSKMYKTVDSYIFGNSYFSL